MNRLAPESLPSGLSQANVESLRLLKARFALGIDLGNCLCCVLRMSPISNRCVRYGSIDGSERSDNISQPVKPQSGARVRRGRMPCTAFKDETRVGAKGKRSLDLSVFASLCPGHRSISGTSCMRKDTLLLKSLRVPRLSAPAGIQAPVKCRDDRSCRIGWRSHPSFAMCRVIPNRCF